MPAPAEPDDPRRRRRRRRDSIKIPAELAPRVRGRGPISVKAGARPLARGARGLRARAALQVDVLKRDLSDGLVLCALAERLTGIKLAPLPPKTPSLRRANLRKALDVLRDWDVPLGWRHPAPATEAGCERGDWGCLLPLLEDCMRCSLKWAPRAAFTENVSVDVAADGEAVSASGDAARPCVGPVRARPPPRRLGEEEDAPPVARRWSDGTSFAGCASADASCAAVRGGHPIYLAPFLPFLVGGAPAGDCTP